MVDAAADTANAADTDNAAQPGSAARTGLAEESDFERIAVVGMAGQFPGANSTEELWSNLLAQKDGLHTFSQEELIELGIPESVIAKPGFVPRGSIIDGYDTFDAKRFAMSPREAAKTDPQARLFLKTCHRALEHAGYPPLAGGSSSSSKNATSRNTGVFAGCNPVDYAALIGEPDYSDSLSSFDQMIGNDRDFLATRVAFKLGLTGPALNVQSACSTSLVAVHLAAQHLLEFQCDMAIAGGVSLNFRQGIGYFYQDGMILSPDGRCRAFDSGANGTTLGQGSGAVILKRLSDALNDGDTIHAVIDGSAINNDGGDKISYTAPSRAGQAKVVAMAHSVAGIDSREVTYVEAHGTGTNLGDPVEIEGLTRAFRLHTDEVAFCRIGSIKSSIGHLDAAAGIAGFIKAVLCVKHGKIPATLHYEQPNPAIDFANSPFVVADATQEWDPVDIGIRRAGISAFGIGGTNAHVVISEPPLTVPHVAVALPRLILASATSEASADRTIEALRTWSETGGGGVDAGPVSDGAIDTLWSGRTPHKIRRSFTLNPESERSLTPTRTGAAGPIPNQVWLFSGQGAQFPGVANGLGHYAPIFRTRYEEIAQFFLDFEGIDVGDLALHNRSDAGAVARLRQTELTQPAIFTHQLAMASVLDDLGCKPSAVLGHSIGEFAALVVAGGLIWQDGARAVASRGRCMAAMPAGAMLATQLSEAQLRPFLNQANQKVPKQANTPASLAASLTDNSSVVEIAALNTSQSTVASGPFEAIARLEAFLTDAGHRSRVLQTSHAFHSAMMDEAAKQFQETLNELAFQAPSIDVMCNLTGRWLTADQATDPSHWAAQMRSPVRFWQCLENLGEPAPIAGRIADTGPSLLVELGPGSTLSSFAVAASSSAATSSADKSERPEPVSLSLNQGDHRQPVAALLDGLGALWCHGVAFDAPPDLLVQGKALSLQKAEAPGSVLDPKPCWLPQRRHLLAPLPGDDAGLDASRAGTAQTAATQTGATSREHPDRWLYGRSWTSLIPIPQLSASSPEIIVIAHDGWVLDKVCDALHIEGTNGRFIPLSEVSDRDGVLDEEALALVLQTCISPGTSALSETSALSGTPALSAASASTATTPARDLHVFHVARTTASSSQPTLSTVAEVRSSLNSGAHALLGFARVLAPLSQSRSVHLTSVASGAFSVTGNESVDASSTALLGPIKVIPLEYSGISTSLVDLDHHADLGQLRAVLTSKSDPVLAVRGNRCWVPGVTLAEQPEPEDHDLPLRQGGHYLLVGGLGGVGLSIADYLADCFGAKLTLTSRSGRPTPESVPSKSETDGPSESQRRLDLLEAVEAKASAVSIHQADAADPVQMSAVIRAAIAQNGPIHGVFFGAGVADQAGAIHRRSQRAADDAISAKVYGAGALSTALNSHELQAHQTDNHKLDFVVLSSSIASELYHNRFGQVGYVTANSYIEAFAHSGLFNTDRLVTVAWDDWTDIGMSVRAAQEFRKDQDSELDLVDELHSFSPEDGLGIFKRALLSSEPVLYVSTTDLAARVERDKNEESPFLAQAIAADTGPDLEAQSVIDAVRQVWVQLLGTDDFGDDDDFFELGGDSLQVARMADRLGNFVDQEIPLDLVFDNPTVAKLSHALDQGIETSVALAEVQGEVPLAPAQRRFLQRHSANPMYFNVSLMLEVDRPLDKANFDRIVARLVERHDVLRTRFSSIDPATAVQLVGQEPTVAVSHVDAPDVSLSSDPALSWAAHARQLQHSLDLVEGPVAAFCLYDDSGQAGPKQQIVLLLHHMISDRLSLLQLVSEFDRLVGEGGSEAGAGGVAQAGRSADIGPAPTAYSGWSLAMSRWGESPQADSERHRWRALADQLGPVRSFPQLAGPQHQLNQSATQLKVKLDKFDSASILSGGQGQPQVKLLTSLAHALGPLALTSDPGREIDGVPAAGSVIRFDCLGHGRRQLADVDSVRTLGFFLSYCPVWVDGAATVAGGNANLIEQLRNNWSYDLLVDGQSNMPQQDMPGQTSDEQTHDDPSSVQPSVEMSRDRLLEPGSILFNFIGQAIESEPLEHMRILEVDKGPDTLPENNRDHPLAISVAIDETGCLNLTFVYPKTALDEAQMDAVATRFVDSVRNLWVGISDTELVQ